MSKRPGYGLGLERFAIPALSRMMYPYYYCGALCFSGHVLGMTGWAMIPLHALTWQFLCEERESRPGSCEGVGRASPLPQERWRRLQDLRHPGLGGEAGADWGMQQLFGVFRDNEDGNRDS